MSDSAPSTLSVANLQTMLGFGTKRDEVPTPKELYDILNEEFGFDFDPCPMNYTVDGLTCEWGNINYVNPPYSNIEAWLSKAVAEQAKGRTSVMLVPARIRSRYWNRLIFPLANEIRFIAGGVRFPGYSADASFPLSIVIYQGNDVRGTPDDKQKKHGKYDWIAVRGDAFRYVCRCD